MIVEGQGIGLWTRVRFPPIPFEGSIGNTVFIGVSRLTDLLKVLFQTVSDHFKP